MLSKTQNNQYLYIVQSTSEPSMCKIGITCDLDRRLKEYNSITGRSKNNVYSYLFACEVKNAREIENDIKVNFSHLRERSNREIYFFNEKLLDLYVEFIKDHKLFKNEVKLNRKQCNKKIVKVVKKNRPSLKDGVLTRSKMMVKARNVKNDEFYTLYEDVKREILSYPLYFWDGKCVFCNCNDAVGDSKTDKDSSAFALFFIRNFKQLGLKKLICTHYTGQTDLFNSGAKGYVFTKSGAKELITTERGYTGSFDDPLSLKILREEADVVCTNPPFSRSLDFWKLMISSGKKFLFLSNESCAVTSSYIKLLREKKIWPGYHSVYTYLNPKREIVRAAGRWYTNLDVGIRPGLKNIKFLKLDEIPDKYKCFDDNGVLVVNNSYIPIDYEDQFAVSCAPVLNGVLDNGFEISNNSSYRPVIGGKIKFSRVLIKKKKQTAVEP